MPKDGGIGASTKRRGDDIQTAGECAAVFARSNVANGTIKSIDTSAAAAMPGVLAMPAGRLSVATASR